MALLIILRVVWTSENETRGVVLDYRAPASLTTAGVLSYDLLFAILELN